MTEEIECPVLCDCGKWFELQEGNPEVANEIFLKEKLTRLEAGLDRCKRALEKCREQRNCYMVEAIIEGNSTQFPSDIKAKDDAEIQTILDGKVVGYVIEQGLVDGPKTRKEVRFEEGK